MNKRRLHIFFVSWFSLILTNHAGDLSQGLQLHYSFEDATGTMVYDNSGHSNNAVVCGNVAFENTGFGKAARFSSPKSYLDVVSTSLNMSGWSGVSVSAWILLKGRTSYEHLIGRGGLTNSDLGTFEFAFGNSYGAGLWAVRTSQVSTLTAQANAPGLDLERWYHVVGTYNGTQSVYYVDGIKKTNSISNALFSPLWDNPLNHLIIGTVNRKPYIDWGDMFFNGLVDELRIYNKALTPQEVLELKNFQLAIDNANGISSMTESSVVINATLLYTNSAPTRVSFCWGTFDAGTNLATWQNITNVGPKDVGFVSTSITGLTTNLTYYYRSMASNILSTAWASSSHEFILSPLQLLAEDDLQLYYRFDHDTGTNVWDSSGKGNHGYIVGQITKMSSPFGSAAKFGYHNYIVCASTNLNANGWEGMTVSAWVLKKSQTTYAHVLGRGGLATTSEGAFELAIGSVYKGGILAVRQTNGAAYSFTVTSNSIDLEAWHLLVATYDTTQTVYYVDGIKRESCVFPVSGKPLWDSAGSKFVIGTVNRMPYLNWSDMHFDGLVDEVRVYKRSLSSNDVIRLYGSDLGNHSPVCMVNALPTNGVIPLKVKLDLSASYDPDGTLVRWEIDREGDGAYELFGSDIGVVFVEYCQPGLYLTKVKVIDNKGAETISEISVQANPLMAPIVRLSATPSSGSAPLTLILKGTNSQANIGHLLQVYEWDPDGDGEYDAITTNGLLQWTYRMPGTNCPSLRITDDYGLQSSCIITIIVSKSIQPPTLLLEVCPEEGSVPLYVSFDAMITGGVASNFAWDFDGNGTIDLSTSTNNAQYSYQKAGVYRATLTVTTTNGLSAQSFRSIRVQEASLLKTWIVAPANGRHLAGSSVSLHAQTAPGAKTASLQFQYKPQSDTNWIDLGSVLYPPPYSFRTTWDVSSLINGTEYDLRVRAMDIQSNIVYSSDEVRVVIDNAATSTNNCIIEGLTNGIHQKKEASQHDKESSIDLFDGTSIRIPEGLSDSNVLITVDLIGANQNPTNGMTFGRQSLDINREISVEAFSALPKEVEIIIPYADVNNDGIVDGTMIREGSLVGYWFDKEQNTWRKTLRSDVHAEENCIIIKTHHLTEFGVFGNINLLNPVNGGVLCGIPQGFTNSTSAAMVTDDNYLSYWRSTVLPSGAQVFMWSFENGNYAAINQIAIRNYGDSSLGFSRYSKDIEVAVSDDGLSFVIWTNVTLSANEIPQTVAAGPKVCKYLRVSITNGYDSQAWELAEVEAFGISSPDADQDGLLDDWEATVFGSLANDGISDADQDGLSNQQELSLGTNPLEKDSDHDGFVDFQEWTAGTIATNPRSYFSCSFDPNTNASLPSTNFVVSFETQTGRVYKFLANDNLTTTNWFPLSEIIGNGMVQSFTNTDQAPTRRFFRIGVGIQ